MPDDVLRIVLRSVPEKVFIPGVFSTTPQAIAMRQAATRHRIADLPPICPDGRFPVPLTSGRPGSAAI
jgi:hypothetical protein